MILADSGPTALPPSDRKHVQGYYPLIQRDGLAVEGRQQQKQQLSIIGYCDIKPVVSRPDDDLGKLAATSAAVAAVGMSSSVAKNAPRLQRMLSVPR